MESEVPVVSTTSSANLMDSKIEAENSDANNLIDEGDNNSNSNKQMTHDDVSNKTEASEDNIQLIEGLTKPSSALEKVDFVRDSRNRVKLYVLCDQRAWDDRGTGHVACLPSPESNNTWCIVVRLESNERNVLESKILQETTYQKQQGTLIVWSETESVDLALSFQEKAGCTELWEKICKIQGRDPDAETELEDNECDDQDVPSDSSTSVVSNATGVPPCNLQNLGELEQALSNSMFANSQREKMANAILQSSYIPKLCEMFSISEDLENKEALQQMASIAKNLFLLNNNAVLNELVEDKYFKNIVGMLEYDVSSSEPKMHRNFLWERSRFREVLPISSEELKSKIHQTFRLQYVQDVCLPAPSIFEENLLTVLSSHLFFMRAEIVNSLLNDKNLMQKLFEGLRNPDITPDTQRDLTNFLKEFCSFAHSLQPTGPQGREQFFKTLMANNVLEIIDPCISSPLASTRTATVELLSIIVDFNAQIFRDFLVRQFRIVPESKNSSLLINKLINHMLSDKDPEFTSAHQIANAIRILLDPESIVSKGEKGEFLQMFYKRAMNTLCAPIHENAKNGHPISDSYYMANKLTLVIDLLCFFVEHHSYNMRTYAIQRGMLLSILVYLKSKHHFLAHCALRLLRRIIGLKDDIYFRHICDKSILDPVVECFEANGSRYNLLNSSLIELFEYIRTEEIRPLMQYVIQKHWETTFSKVEYVRTFSVMKTRCAQFADTFSFERDSASKENTGLAMTPPPNSQWRKEREHDDEELFFSKEDEDEMPAPQLRKSGMEPMFPSLANRKRKALDDEDSISSVFGGNITPPAGSNVRISKIMIRMNTKEITPTPRQSVVVQQQLPQQQAVDSTVEPDTDLPPFGEPKPHQQQSTAISTTTSPATDSCSTDSTTTTTSSSSPPSSTTLKRPLVDYDLSDDDDDDGEGNGKESKLSKSLSRSQTKIVVGEEKQPNKILKLSTDETPDSSRDASSPPPDPEQKGSDRMGGGGRGGGNGQQQDISTSS
uniref:Serine/threonine-protein phosphatase 4 regulatory subunit 3-like central domain-containing protein n=1 Tax=Meloidogyne incognita TaxID=6306 RepID=A0A914LK23_MELIC